MGLGGYLAARSDAEHYASERTREIAETGAKPAAEAAEVAPIFRLRAHAEESEPIITTFRKRPEAWVRLHDALRARTREAGPRAGPQSALTIGGAYVVGGFIPLAPYMRSRRPRGSDRSGSTLVTLAIFGWIKGHFTGTPPIRSAIQTMLIGGAVAAAAFAIARAIA